MGGCFLAAVDVDLAEHGGVGGFASGVFAMDFRLAVGVALGAAQALVFLYFHSVVSGCVDGRGGEGMAGVGGEAF